MGNFYVCIIIFSPCLIAPLRRLSTRIIRLLRLIFINASAAFGPLRVRERSASNGSRHDRFAIAHWWRSPLANGQPSTGHLFSPARYVFPPRDFIETSRAREAIFAPDDSPTRMGYGWRLSRLKAEPYMCTVTFPAAGARGIRGHLN